jgi:phosphatidylserine/phosphatidylglycerophosphate/cardiolipin synthase-like enzyme
MRFKSTTTNGYTVYAVTGVNTISFAIDFEKANTSGLLGFAIERNDLATNERKFLTGFKVFQHLIPNPTADTTVSTLEHPMQSFVWEDMSLQPDQSYEYFFYPMTGTVGALKKGKPIKLTVTMEPLFSDKEHDVFFNRGTASSRAYAAKFGRVHPLAMKEPKKSEGLAWLSRDLSAAIFKFIGQAKKGDALRCCFYEFSYVPVLQALKKAIEDGVDVQIILDMKESEKPPSQPRDESLEAIHKAGFPMQNIIERTANPKEIQHNKFMVFIEGGKTPKAVWTGSTNITFAGIHGHSNVGHWVRNENVAAKYMEYWTLLKTNPGGLAGETDAVQKQKHQAYQKAIDQIQPAIKPSDMAKIPVGTTAFFSPMSDLTALKLYAELLDKAKTFSCITLPFGINKTLTDPFLDNTDKSQLVFMMFDTEPKDLILNEKHHVFVTWGVDTDSVVTETTGRTRLNSNVEFLHTKILLMDPLSADPIVVSGSSNYTNKSTVNNDENMLVMRGDKRVADIYLTEFNRLFHQFHQAAVLKGMKDEEKKAGVADSMFLQETDGWLKKYEVGTLKYKRVKSFTGMTL